jgi:hypothetical protein
VGSPDRKENPVRNLRSISVWLLFEAVIAILGGGQSRADQFTLNFDPTSTFSGDTPNGSLSVTFTDVAGGVQIVMNSNLVGNENLDPNKALYLNLDPSKASLLSTLSLSGLQASSGGFTDVASLGKGVNAFKADGDGSYDMLLNWGPSVKALHGGESQTYTILVLQRKKNCHRTGRSLS